MFARGAQAPLVVVPASLGLRAGLAGFAVGRDPPRGLAQPGKCSGSGRMEWPRAEIFRIRTYELSLVVIEVKVKRLQGITRTPPHGKRHGERTLASAVWGLFRTAQEGRAVEAPLARLHPGAKCRDAAAVAGVPDVRLAASGAR
jgi:hypothetical protein